MAMVEGLIEHLEKLAKEQFVELYGEPKVSGIQKPALVRATEN